jgi:hypothetical protein
MNWPLQRDCDSFYGNPRGKNVTQPSAKWESAYLVPFKPPFRITYAGKLVSQFKVNKNCLVGFQEAFNNLLNAAGGKQKTLDHWGVSIFAGCYNYRLMRGGNSLSMHSWGCAIDLDPANNSLSDNTPRFAQFPEVLDAWAKTGAVWGGDWNGNNDTLDERRCDGMHWQFAKLTNSKAVVPNNIVKPAQPVTNQVIPAIVVAKRGDQSSYVADLQKMLIRKGSKITADGDFGLATEIAVKDFQKNNGLNITGTIDTNTLNKLMV